MEHILLGSLAFLIAFFFDLAAIKRIRYLKQIIGLACISLFGYSLFAVCFAPVKLRLPDWLSRMGWLFFLVSFSLLVYSLFLEIPFRQTYAADGVGDRGMRRPNFFIVGAPKCGTTAMNQYLGQHPEIFMCPFKETDHFAEDLERHRNPRFETRSAYLGFFSQGHLLDAWKALQVAQSLISWSGVIPMRDLFRSVKIPDVV